MLSLNLENATLTKRRQTMGKKLTLLVMPNKRCLELGITSPVTQVSFNSDSEIPDQIHQQVQGNGSLQSVPENLQIRIIPENAKNWKRWRARAQDQRGKSLTYVLTGELRKLVPSLGIYGNDAPVVLYWRK